MRGRSGSASPILTGNETRGCLPTFLLALWGALFLPGPAAPFEVTETLSVGGVLAGIYHTQTLTEAPGYDSTGRGLLAFQPEAHFKPTVEDELCVKLGFGAGNGLMGEGISPFILAPWGGDTEDSVKNINGRNRDYLLTAWYSHTFRFGGDHALGVAGGIIDATDYMDDNAFANNEYAQFMNQALVNAPHAFLPSYDLGGVFQWQWGGFTATGLAMALGSNGKEGTLEEPYNAYFLELQQALDLAPGKGTYRLLLGASSKGFYDPEGTRKERRNCVMLSFDQELGKILGAWIRCGWQDDRAAIDYREIYSGGLALKGLPWGREEDTLGIGYGRLGGGNLEVDHTEVFEVYGRVALNSVFAITGDVQYMKDAMKAGGGPGGWIFGLRATAEF